MDSIEKSEPDDDIYDFCLKRKKDFFYAKHDVCYEYEDLNEILPISEDSNTEYNPKNFKEFFDLIYSQNNAFGNDSFFAQKLSQRNLYC